MKKQIFFFIIFLIGQCVQAQNIPLWIPLHQAVAESLKMRTGNYAKQEKKIKLNHQQLRRLLSGAADKLSGTAGKIIEFPNLNGTYESFEVWENSNFVSELQAKYPDIRAYVGKSIDNPAVKIYFSLSPSGIQTMTLRPDSGAEFIEPYTRDHQMYVLFDSATRILPELSFECNTINSEIGTFNSENRSDNQVYKTMRLALSCTGEYGQFFGGTLTGVLAAMNATMTRVNGVFETDLALHLNIIDQTTNVIYTNPDNDPYSPANLRTNWNAEVQQTLSSLVGDEYYDIGHLFGASGGGGDAGCLGCVCENGKGRGYTSPSNSLPIPQGDFFDIDYVAHEMGHQLGGNHTFSHLYEGTGVNVEPGSGSTVMAYAGITNYNVQPHSDAYFTYRSVKQIQDNLATKTCPVSFPLSNTPPIVDAGTDFSVPAATAYVLSGSAIDAENDTLTYCWEENDNSSPQLSAANSYASLTKPSGPNYRSFIPKSTPERIMPEMEKVLSGALSSSWESVSNVGRTLNFTLTVRDQHPAGAQTATDAVTVTSLEPYSINNPNGVGPFAVTSQNMLGITWTQQSLQTITWSVNNTTSLPGSDRVRISLSVDGGNHFDYILAENTPNDGSEEITIPADVPASINCRIKIEPMGNHYFAVNARPFYIGYEAISNCQTYIYDTPFSLPDGASAFTTKTISVPDEGVITDVNIGFQLTHPNVSDLTLAFIRPNGVLGTLFNRQCSGTTNLNVNFDAQGAVFNCGQTQEGNFQPPTGYDMNLMNESNPQGNWQFGFKDAAAGSVGTVDKITLEICTRSYQLLQQKQWVKDQIILYPNPNKGDFYLKRSSLVGNEIQIDITDLSGRKIYEQMDKFADNQDLAVHPVNLSKGVYLVNVSENSVKTTFKMFVE